MQTPDVNPPNDTKGAAKSAEAMMCDLEMPKPWERFQDESQLHYTWFHHWLTQGPNRSMLASYNFFLRQKHEKTGKTTAFKPADTITDAWRDAYVTYDWRPRVEAFDTYQREKDMEAYEKRMSAFQDRAFSVGEKMLSRAEQMLALPLTKPKEVSRTTSEDGQTVVITNIVPAKWTLDTVPRLVSSAVQMLQVSNAIEIKKLLEEMDDLDDDQLLAQAEAAIKARRG